MNEFPVSLQDRQPALLGFPIDIISRRGGGVIKIHSAQLNTNKD